MYCSPQLKKKQRWAIFQKHLQYQISLKSVNPLTVTEWSICGRKVQNARSGGRISRKGRNQRRNIDLSWLGGTCKSPRPVSQNLLTEHGYVITEGQQNSPTPSRNFVCYKQN